MSGCYNSNSSSQLSVVLTSKSYIEHAIGVFSANSPVTIIADYGAAHGLNSFHAMNMIIESLREKNKVNTSQPILVVHNDLPTNDWSSMFEVLNAGNSASYYGVVSGRSFYEQCLPDNSLSIGYSSSSLHWLSCKPVNLTNHCCSAYISEDDPDRLAFARQSLVDYEHFLEYRSRELVQGGVLILSIPSWDRSDVAAASSPMHMHLLYECAQAHLTPAELLEYTIPVHVRWYDDCVDRTRFTRYSLELIKEEHVVVDSPLMQRLNDGIMTVDEFARERTLIMRSWTDALLQRALAMNEEKEKITNLFWAMYEERVKEQPHMHHSQMRVTFLILQKK